MLRISVLCDDAEAMYNMWQKILHDPTGKFKVVRLKNKIGKGQTPYLAVWKTALPRRASRGGHQDLMFPHRYNYHINASFQPPELSVPIMVEIQLWSTKIMALNDLSHWAYEIARAKTPEAV